MDNHDNNTDPEFDPNRQLKFDADPDIWDISGSKPSGWYRIDPDKIKTLQDMIMLLDAINIKFINTHPEFDKISHLLKEDK